MAKDKNGFVLYKDLLPTIKKLVERDRANKTNYAGELFLHILEYVNDENPVAIDFIIEMAFEPIKQTLKRDLKKYEMKLESKSISGRVGNLKRWNEDLFYQYESKFISLEEAEEIAESRKYRKCDKSIAKIADTDTDSDSVSGSDILLKKETKKENLSKENPTENFPKTESVEPGAEERKKVAPKKERSEEQLIMPDEFIEIWEEWKEYRKAKRFKSYAGLKWEQMAVDKLLELSDKNPTTAKLILKQTYENSYQGFFPLKQNTNGITKTTNAGFSTSKPSTNNSNSGKRSYRQILAERLKNESKANGEGSNITIDVEICE